MYHYRIKKYNYKNAQHFSFLFARSQGKAERIKKKEKIQREEINIMLNFMKNKKTYMQIHSQCVCVGAKNYNNKFYY